MKRLVSGPVLAFTIALTVVQAAPVMAQDEVKSQIKIAYEEPTNTNYRPIYERLKQRRILERLQQFLAPLRLPREFILRTAQCGALSVPYKAGQPVSICYEYIAQIEKVAPPDDKFGGVTAVGQALVTREMAIVGPVVQGVLHDVARAVFDLLEIPVWGNAEDAADNVAAFLMLQFGADVAQKTIFGTAYFLQATNTNQIDFASIRPHVLQRYYNFLCIVVGGDFIRYAMFIPLNRKELPGDLPTSRLGSCVSLDAPEYSEYNKVKYAFVKTILEEYVDQDLLQQVRTTDWLKDD